MTIVGVTPSFEREDPHDIALLLTRYLADLPEALCTAVLFDDFIKLESKLTGDSWRKL